MQTTSVDEGNKHRTVVLEVHDKKTIPDEPACCSCPKCFKVSPITATALMGLSSILAFGSGFFQSSYMSFGSGVISVFALVLQRRESLMLLSAATGVQHPGGGVV